MKRILLFCIGVSILFLAGCDKDKDTDLFPQGTTTPPTRAYVPDTPYKPPVTIFTPLIDSVKTYLFNGYVNSDLKIVVLTSYGSELIVHAELELELDPLSWRETNFDREMKARQRIKEDIEMFHFLYKFFGFKKFYARWTVTYSVRPTYQNGFSERVQREFTYRVDVYDFETIATIGTVITIRYF